NFRCSVKVLIREVNKATCASGEPVSVSCRPNSLRISDFFSAVNAMRLSPISYFSPHEKSSLRHYFTTAANYSHKAITYLTVFAQVVQIVAPARRGNTARSYPRLPQRLHGFLPQSHPTVQVCDEWWGLRYRPAGEESNNPPSHDQLQLPRPTGHARRSHPCADYFPDKRRCNSRPYQQRHLQLAFPATNPPQHV